MIHRSYFGSFCLSSAVIATYLETCCFLLLEIFLVIFYADIRKLMVNLVTHCRHHLPLLYLLFDAGFSCGCRAQ